MCDWNIKNEPSHWNIGLVSLTLRLVYAQIDLNVYSKSAGTGTMYYVQLVTVMISLKFDVNSQK